MQVSDLSELSEQLSDNLEDWKNEFEASLTMQQEYFSKVSAGFDTIDSTLRELLGSYNVTIEDLEVKITMDPMALGILNDDTTERQEAEKTRNAIMNEGKNFIAALQAAIARRDTAEVNRLLSQYQNLSQGTKNIYELVAQQ